MRVATCKNGLPFDVAFSAADEFILAWIVVAGEVEGAKFDWNVMAFEERK